LNLSLLFALDGDKKEEEFYFDAIVFKNKSDFNGRLDIFAVFPFKNFKFLNNNEMFISKYNVEYLILDNNNEQIQSKKFNKSIVEENYSKTQSVNGEFELNQYSFVLPDGNYKIIVRLYDEIAEKMFEKSKSFSIINFYEFDFSLSGIMLVSEIEENNGKFKLTPFISENISKLNSNFFIFYESYFNPTKSQNYDYDLFIKIYDDKDNVVYEKSKILQKIKIDSVIINSNQNTLISKQFYIYINDIKKISNGKYTIKIFAANPTISDDFEEKNLIAVSQRSIVYYDDQNSQIENNLENSIKQLRYVASQTEIDKINSGKNEVEKIILFKEYWQLLDPSPNTERNEAFEDYYQKIQYSNNNFKSYTEGWLTDKGQIYIVLGKPTNIEKSQDATRRVMYERWVYGGREFIFADNNGFGDFRLVRPYSFNEKYQYISY